MVYTGAPNLPDIPPVSKDDGPNYLAFIAVLKDLLAGKSIFIAAPSSIALWKADGTTTFIISCETIVILGYRFAISRCTHHIWHPRLLQHTLYLSQRLYACRRTINGFGHRVRDGAHIRACQSTPLSGEKWRTTKLQSRASERRGWQ